MSARSESRVVRPFAGLGRVGESLATSRLVLNGEAAELDSVTRTAQELATDSFAIEVDVDLKAVSDAVESLGIPEVDVGFVVVATGRTLKASVILHKSLIIGEGAPDRIDLSKELFPEIFGDSRGFSVRCAIVLLHDLQPRPLKPHLAGTWLARRDFAVIPESDVLGGFNPSRLTAEARQRFGLPDGTVSFVHVKDSLLEAESLNESVEFLIDEQIHDSLYLDQNSTFGQVMQVEFALDFILTVTQSIVAELRETGLLDIEGEVLDARSPAGVFLKNASSLTGMPIPELAEALRHNPMRVRSLVQDALDMRDYVLSGLKGAK